MNDMHISMLAVALAALVAIWLGYRCIRLRFSEGITHGDGGNALMARRMRAQANFGEYTPFALLMIVLLDLADRDGWPLALAALAFIAGRVVHAIGMDSEKAGLPRQLGMILTFTILAGLAVWTALVGLRIV